MQRAAPSSWARQGSANCSMPLRGVYFSSSMIMSGFEPAYRCPLVTLRGGNILPPLGRTDSPARREVPLVVAAASCRRWVKTLGEHHCPSDTACVAVFARRNARSGMALTRPSRRRSFSSGSERNRSPLPISQDMGISREKLRRVEAELYITSRGANDMRDKSRL